MKEIDPQTNIENHYAIAIKKDEIVIGHLPRSLSRVCSLLRVCTVTGAKRSLADLPQGGLEVPCFLLFKT